MPTYLGNVRGNDSNLCEAVQDVIQPSREKRSTGFGEIKPTDCTKLDSKALEEDGK